MLPTGKRTVHPYPAWRSRAKFLINGSWYREDGNPDTRRHEQLWARLTDINRFEICCIQFLVRNLALGDEVETAADSESKYQMQRVIRSSGRRTYRVLFGGTLDEAAQLRFSNQIQELDCLFEWSSGCHVAVDAASVEQAR